MRDKCTENYFDLFSALYEELMRSKIQKTPKITDQKCMKIKKEGFNVVCEKFLTSRLKEIIGNTGWGPKKHCRAYRKNSK